MSASVITLFAAAPAIAQTWDGSESTDWFTGDNWDGGTVPDGTADVEINIAAPNPTVISDVDANGTALATEITIGIGTGGQLTVENGGAFSGVAPAAVFGVLNGGEATVTGVNRTGPVDRRSTVFTESGLYVGRFGEGTFSVLDGGITEVGRLAGPGSMPTAQGVLIGLFSGGDGHVLVSGVNRAGSTHYRSTLASSNDMNVGVGLGGAAEGNLQILDGGLVTVFDKASIGDIDGSVGNVLVSGVSSSGGTAYRSTWSIGDSLTFGGPLFVSDPDGGTGTLTISEGGLVEVANGSGPVNMGRGPTSNATMNIGAAAGETAAAPGYLEAGILNFGNGDGTLVFNHTDSSGSYRFTPDFATTTTTGTPTQSVLQEAGYTVLTGDLSTFTGTIDVNGGTLGGAFTTGGDLNVNAGTIAPGMSIGTVNVANATFDPGIIYDVEIDGAGNSDLISASGTATINGGDVSVSGTYLIDHRYTIVTAAGGRTGTFDGVNDTLFIDNILSYDTNSAFLTPTIARSFCSAANSTNQQSVACDGLDSTPTGNPVIQALYDLTSAEHARRAFDLLSGEIHPSIKGALMDNGQERVDAIGERLRSATPGGAGPVPVAAFGSLAPADLPVASADFAAFSPTRSYGLPEMRGRDGFWMSGYGSWNETDETANTAAMDNDTAGVIFGVDTAPSGLWRFGLAGGYSETDVAQDERLSSGTVDTLSLGTYGGFDNGRSQVQLGALYNLYTIDTERTVAFPGISQVLEAGYNAESWQVFAEAGHRIRTGAYAFEPFANLSHVSIQTDGFTESGGSAALTAASDTQDTTFTTLGVRVSGAAAEGVRIRGMTGWRHAFGDTDPSTSFVLASSAPFTVNGAPITEDALVAEAGFDLDLTDSVTFGASYSGQFGGGVTNHGVRGRMSVAF